MMSMELAIYFPNMERLNKMDDELRFVDMQAAPTYLAATVFTFDANLVEYIGNPNALSWLNIFIKDGLEFSRLYFGQEFCQNLIPGPTEIEESYYYSRQLAWDYTYVTGGYLTEAGINKVRKNLQRLRDLDAKCEVVFNDWGVLRIIKREFPEFTPVLGRILNKQTRLQMFTIPGSKLPILPLEIQTPLDQIERNQLRAYADISLSNPEYLEQLHAFGIKNVDLDIVPQGVLRPADGWGLNLGFYYPWAFIATGRGCPTAGTVDPARTFMIKDEPCPRPCRKYNCTPNLQSIAEVPMVQRGPALMVYHGDYAEPYFKGKIPFERFIFEPYIPI